MPEAPLTPAEAQALAFQAVADAALRHGFGSPAVGRVLRTQVVALQGSDDVRLVRAYAPHAAAASNS